ncbi:hypothetical protein Sta7437_1588 [Stanieria cyanosphaera PCC 7437]|uniref:Glycosyltransferase RgtA/B/C/D-like domain-containing protein n=1 Tax=Stanieria cyanosphaera (strain ATCC 29371 / PCC 7437) TaxID=111780 RepID=K9XSW5_STAC7|nr:glycosyltransferase family 39 protein [Stanieria cyanosphaera]AFZ35154.1 hypothetical protein Sta7437_1588 [Stanieria cyanosphaera PCC 7437]
MKISLIGSKTFGKTIKDYAWFCLIILIICLGIFFRCANLEQKIFWVDEVATYVRISGYTQAEVTQKLTNQEWLSVADLQQYQKVSSARNLHDTFNALKKSPEHAPLYFLLARFWVQIFGNSVTAIRSLSVVCSLLALLCLYWLGWELFKSTKTADLSMMLLSVSPFYVAYAQEARPYSLWTVTILLSSAILLRALRTNQLQNWLFYTVSSILAFYISLFSFLVVIGQGSYVFIINKFKFNQKTSNYLLSLSLAVIAFLPWCLVIAQNWQALQDNTSWMDQPLQISAMLGIWIASILLIFGDLPLSSDLNPLKVVIILVMLVVILGLGIIIYFYFQKKYLKKNRLIWYLSFTIVGILITIYQNKLDQSSLVAILDPVTFIGISTALILLILVFYSLLFLIFNHQQKITWFILTQAIATPTILIITDLIFNDQRSATPRYLIPAQLGIHLAVVCLLASQLGWINWMKKSQPQLGRIILSFLLVLGIISCTLNLEKSPQYQKSRNLHNISIAEIINQAQSPILISEANQTMDVISLSYNLQTKVKIKFIDSNATLFKLLDITNPIFLFNPSTQLKQSIQNNIQISMKEIYQPKLITPGEIHLTLWSIKRK